ncbi:hypothetical protein AWRI1631_161720 [Saccharomyces cerevisiae AWRI1631]|uniref:Uncharacterized protein n=1 Tax=Saccharomyces cerevisiae (strain AWRI1631) TaxID=545124 RepID=B5VT74_YEAS6|nr:hypothetical protein AWRI1631_161720 [Saccharomyces cerevisiae AWRI1631]
MNTVFVFSSTRESVKKSMVKPLVTNSRVTSSRSLVVTTNKVSQ